MTAQPKEYKNFEWDISFKVSVDEYKDSLEDDGWDVMGDTSLNEGAIIIVHCERDSSGQENSFLEN